MSSPVPFPILSFQCELSPLKVQVKGPFSTQGEWIHIRHPQAKFSPHPEGGAGGQES